MTKKPRHLGGVFHSQGKEPVRWFQGGRGLCQVLADANGSTARFVRGDIAWIAAH